MRSSAWFSFVVLMVLLGLVAAQAFMACRETTVPADVPPMSSLSLSASGSYGDWVVTTKTVTKTLDTTYVFFKPAFGGERVAPDTTTGKLPPQYVTYGGMGGVNVGTWLVTGVAAVVDSNNLIVKPIVRIGPNAGDWRIVHNDSTRVGADATAAVYAGTQRMFMTKVLGTTATQTPSGFAFIHRLSSGGVAGSARVGYYVGTVIL